jgi:hypothetical protein
LFCPNCGKQVSETAKFCEKCGVDLGVTSPEKTQPQVSSHPIRCAYHPDRDSVGICAECGKGVCILCKSGVKGKLYCPTCFNKVINKPATVSDSLVKEDLKAGAPGRKAVAPAPVKAENLREPERKQRFKWFRERPNVTILVILAENYHLSFSGISNYTLPNNIGMVIEAEG